jgi:2'-5' RNA ligase
LTEDIRAFIAVELPDQVKRSLSDIQAQLKAGRSRAKWVAPESIHLTLKFLGGISPDTVSGVTQAMEEAALGVSPFRVGVGGLGAFPNSKHAQVVWAGLTGDTATLAQLQKDLDIALARLGFTPESRPFTAHLTLARMRDEASPPEREALGKLVESTSFEAGDFVVDSLSLMRSQLRREGPIYTRMTSVPFVQ